MGKNIDITNRNRFSDGQFTSLQVRNPEEPKQRSYFDLPDKEKKEIMDNAAKASNDAQQEIMRKFEQKACECVTENCSMEDGSWCVTHERHHEECEMAEDCHPIQKEQPAPSLNDWEKKSMT